MNNRGQVLIDQNSIVAKLYKYWENMGGEYWYSENLCHLGRVLLFWIPWYWFWKQKLVWKIRPYMVFALLVALLFTVKLPTLVLNILIVLLSLALAVGGILFVLWAIVQIWDWYNDHYRWGVENWWYSCLPSRIWHGFWTYRIHPHLRIYPWMLAFLVFQAISFFYMRLAFVIMIAGEALAVFLVASWFLIMLVRVGEEKTQVLHSSAHITQTALKPVGTSLIHTLSLIEVIWEWLWSKKSAICPYVEFVDIGKKEQV